MAKNMNLSRRHDINAGERLPERHTRVEDEELYRDNIEAVLKNEGDEAFQAALQAKREAEVKANKYKYETAVPGMVVALRWGGVDFRRVDAIRESGVRIGPHWYGWECIEIPSKELLNLVHKEVGEI